MKIILDTVHFKSRNSFYLKELIGVKRNTVRHMDFFEYEKLLELKIHFVAIHDLYSGNYFVRKLTDISFYDDRVIFSW